MASLGFTILVVWCAITNVQASTELANVTSSQAVIETTEQTSAEFTTDSSAIFPTPNITAESILLSTSEESILPRSGKHDYSTSIEPGRGELNHTAEAPLMIKSGKPLSLTCNLPNNANDDTTVEWIKDGDKENILESDDKYTVFGNNHTLVIKSAKLHEDAGTYECSTTSKTPFTKQFFVYAPSLIKSGKPLSLTCNLPNIAEDDATVEWIKDGDKECILENDDKYTVFGQNHTLLIKSALPDEDEGTYECSATSKTPFTKQFFVYSWHMRHMPKSLVVYEAQDIKMTCEVRGKPNITVQWHKDEQKLDDSDSKYEYSANDDDITKAVLSIKDAQQLDRGNYTCQVFSIQGVYNTSTYVRVKSVYAPLYPAVGILVLFALLALTIFFFERRDAMQEYQESDTDQDGAEIFRYKRHYDE